MNLIRDELSQLFEAGIQPKEIYLFSSNYLNTPEPHYFICIKRTDGNILYMTCCTSKFDTVRRFVESRPEIPQTTVVWIKPNDPNHELYLDTYVNCNNVFSYTIEELMEMYKTGSVQYKGTISNNHYEQLLIGIHNSPLVDEEIKDFIPTDI